MVSCSLLALLYFFIGASTAGLASAASVTVSVPLTGCAGFKRPTNTAYVPSGGFVN